MAVKIKPMSRKHREKARLRLAGLKFWEVVPGDRAHGRLPQLNKRRKLRTKSEFIVACLKAEGAL